MFGLRFDGSRTTRLRHHGTTPRGPITNLLRAVTTTRATNITPIANLPRAATTTRASTLTRATKPYRATKLSRATIIACAAAIVCTTTTVQMNTPDGFARYVEPESVRLISAEGVVLRARVEENSPIQSLEFWSEALTNHLSESGYTLLDESEFDEVAGGGRLMEWLAPVGEDDWVYLTAIVVSEAHIVVVESAGPFEHFRRYREAITTSLGSIVLEEKWIR